MMLTPDGRGQADGFRHRQGVVADHKLTMTGTTMGSLYYMSPEQIQGARRPGCARRPVLGGGVAVRDGDRQAAVRWRQPVRHHVGAPGEDAGAARSALDPRLPQALNDVILMSVAKDAGCALSNRRRVSQCAVQRGARAEAGGSGRGAGTREESGGCRATGGYHCAGGSDGAGSASGAAWEPSWSVDGPRRSGRFAGDCGGNRDRSLERYASGAGESRRTGGAAGSFGAACSRRYAAAVPAGAVAQRRRLRRRPSLRPPFPSPRVRVRESPRGRRVRQRQFPRYRGPWGRRRLLQPPRSRRRQHRSSPCSSLRRSSPRPPRDPVAPNCSRPASISPCWVCARLASARVCNRCSARRPPSGMNLRGDMQEASNLMTAT